MLLLVALVLCFAVDTSVCERGFALMNNLKTARRSQMGNKLLRILMTICSLGEDWEDNPNQIPVDEIIDAWRCCEKRGRYESAMWKAAGLKEPGSKKSKANNPAGASSQGVSSVEVDESEVDNLEVPGG